MTTEPNYRQDFMNIVHDLSAYLQYMKRLGFSWEEMSAINPGLVYCAISGFGQSGPDAFKPAYDQIIQGLSGEMDVNGDERLNPLRAGFPVCDTVGAAIR